MIEGQADDELPERVRAPFPRPPANVVMRNAAGSRACIQPDIYPYMRALNAGISTILRVV